MRILILHTTREKKNRKTIADHLYSFSNYSKEHEFIYVNVGPKGVPSYLRHIHFDVVILHYTLLAGERFLPGDAWNTKMQGLSQLKGYKIAIPQDEYSCTQRLIELFREISVDAVCTCFYLEKDIHFVYAQYLPEKVKYLQVLTGYVDERSIEEVKPKTIKYADRQIDIGYRASMLPAHFGRHGQLKYQLVDEFNNRLTGSNLVLDIKNSNKTLTNDDATVLKFGNSWMDFLLDCKAFIGCEGGSSLLDHTGDIQEKVLQYCSEHPKAGFEEIEKACFPGQDFNISCFAISPRHFEAATTKTLQILVEGYYGGIFKPGVHYLSLKKDYSNFAEIINALSDTEACQKIVDRAYNDIVLSGGHTYKRFVDDVLGLIPATVAEATSGFGLKDHLLVLLLRIRETCMTLYVKYYISPYVLMYKLYSMTLRPYVKGEKKLPFRK